MKWYAVLYLIAFSAIHHGTAMAAQSHPYNEALSSMKSDDVGRAIHGLVETQRMHPSDAHRAGEVLEVYRAEVDLPTPDLFVFGVWRGMGQWAHRAPLQLWFILAVVALMVLIYLNRPSAVRPSVYISIAIACLAGLSILMSLSRATYVHAKDVAVVAYGTPLRSSPYPHADTIQQLFAGQMVRTKGRDHAFAWLQSDTYEEGWVDTAALLLVRPYDVE